MDEFGLQEWSFKFDQAKRRFGQCNYARRSISLSAPLTQLNERPEVEDTIRHEIAHALAGYGTGHGPKWKAQCRVTGADPSRCYDERTVNKPEAKWYLVCLKCGYREPRYRKPKYAASRYTHTRCGDGPMRIEEV